MSNDVSPETVLVEPPAHSPSATATPRIFIGRAVLLATSVLLVAFMAVSSVIGFVVSKNEQRKPWAYRTATCKVQVFQGALVDAETGILDYVLTQKTAYLQSYVSGLSRLETLTPTLLPKLEGCADGLPEMRGETAPVARQIDELRMAWEQAQEVIVAGEPVEAKVGLQTMHSKPMMNKMRIILSGYLAQHDAGVKAAERRISLEQDAMLFINPAGALIAILAIIYAFRLSVRNARGREQATLVSRYASGI